jgi:hypothetical protein
MICIWCRLEKEHEHNHLKYVAILKARLQQNDLPPSPNDLFEVGTSSFDAPCSFASEKMSISCWQICE